jgi:hypothetical protein
VDVLRESEAFRAEVREFCARELPRDVTSKVFRNEVLGKDDYLEYLRTLAHKGLVRRALAAGPWRMRVDAAAAVRVRRGNVSRGRPG